MGAPEARSWKSILAGAMLIALAAAPQTLLAGEGGTSHILPGANATLVDVLPTAPGGFVKPMYLHYNGSASARVPTAAGVAANLEATADTSPAWYTP
jgi:hypothetical protein